MDFSVASSPSPLDWGFGICTSSSLLSNLVVVVGGLAYVIIVTALVGKFGLTTWESTDLGFRLIRLRLVNVKLKIIFRTYKIQNVVCSQESQANSAHIHK